MDTPAGVNFVPEIYVDITRTFAKKVEMCSAHASQNQWMKDIFGYELEAFLEIPAKFRGLRPAARWPRPSARVSLGADFPEALSAAMIVRRHGQTRAARTCGNRVHLGVTGPRPTLRPAFGRPCVFGPADPSPGRHNLLSRSQYASNSAADGGSPESA